METQYSVLVDGFRNRSGNATGILDPTWSREIISVVSYIFSTFSVLFYQQLHSVSFCLQQHRAEVELQVLFILLHTLAAINSGSDISVSMFLLDKQGLFSSYISVPCLHMWFFQ